MGIMQNGKRQVYGVTGSLFGNITASLNISYDLLDSVDEYWGNLLDDGNFTGPLGMLQRNEADVAVGPFSLKVDYLRYLYAAEAHIYEDVPMLSGLKRPFLPGAFSSTDSFEPKMMALLFSSMLALVLLSAWSLRTARGHWATTVQSVFWVYVALLLLKSTSTRRLQSTASQILLASWMIGTFVIGQYLTGQVKAALLIRSPAPRIDTLTEMLARRPPIRPVTLKATPLMNMLQLSGLESYRALHGRIVRMRGELSQTEVYSLRTLRQVVAGETVLIMDATGNRVFVAPHCDTLQPAYFHVSRQRIETADFVWYMNRRLDPRLVAAMNRRIRWLVEGAVPFMHHHEIFRKPATCFLDQHGGSGREAAAVQYEVLHLEDVEAAFLILLCLLAFATTVLLFELAFHKGSALKKK
ncbi:glutamate receptor-like [Dermacentor silvarum]|uniref:glutamate receptor-like n=1 Tax=Dermacentor silvarum TaxID=543639 RepID=UPI00210068C6|nr:glutamate receptor-like [Dermacentor silvarum]